MLAENLSFLEKVNPQLVRRIQEFDKLSNADKNLSRSEFLNNLTVDNQLSDLVYLVHGHLNKYSYAYQSGDVKVQELFADNFNKNEISSEKYETAYADIHDDLHMKHYVGSLIESLKSSDIRSSSRPHKRTQPTFLVLLGLGGREDILELIKKIEPRYVLLIETEMNELHKFLTSHSIPKLKEECSKFKCNVAYSIGLGDAVDIQREIASWANMFNPLGIEGLLLSRNKSISSKNDAIASFLLESPWHVDMLMRMGYQVDEYNMLANTSKNFSSLKQHVFKSRSLPEEYKNLPVVITGSGPSLDASIDVLKECRDQYLLVSGGSSISTLINSGLTPDIHVQLERSEHQFKLHKELSKEHDLSDILLIASSTVPYGLQEIFKNIIYFFRPALSPLSVYANSSSEILSAEGPDTINAAVSSLSHLGFKNISLVGVDCGSRSKSAIRSKGAFGGYIPRTLNKVELGNDRKTVFTNARLQSVRDALHVALSRSKAKSINYSQGIQIPCSQYCDISQLPQQLLVDSGLSSSDAVNLKSHITSILLKHSSPITRERLYSSWQLADVRQKCFTFFRTLEMIINQCDDIRDISAGISKLISLDVQRRTKSDQLIPRVTRGTLGKIMPVTINYLNSVHPDDYSIALDFIKSFLADFVDKLESDVYSVFDAIEPAE